ncbi:uncharacterized protein BX663DRAFT_514754 [Cokeromyces recurvatus]|uniref:uncharacterized protein n=1 Tax=Cokeromyces recurvatus TaxID=90255 RepID=UPI0022202BF3|nr:uncharacterized protein BX663DRAFT_514754 [Cokeromyces recurvatus]KAI7901538.1 hypothetical protein BX663DRAFT_514754 [Cokeromyces recurvatus]
MMKYNRQPSSHHHHQCIPSSSHQQSYHPKHTRAHTTSGYPPTMWLDPYKQQSYNHPIQSPPSSTTRLTAKEEKRTTKIFYCPSFEKQQTYRHHCHHCQKSFSRPSSLRIHIYSHTGEKPYQCHHQGCGRSFSVHSNMRRHLRIHHSSEFNNKQIQL